MVYIAQAFVELDDGGVVSAHHDLQLGYAFSRSHDLAAFIRSRPILASRFRDGGQVVHPAPMIIVPCYHPG